MNTQPIAHTNAFLALNGRPFVLAEYVDNEPLIQLDRSLVKSEIIVDQSEAYRAIIDISIDDIGKKASDGSMNIIGNATKFEDLLGMIRANYRNLDRQLPLLKKGIVLRVNYQLENNRTGQIIRTLVEDLRINDRTYFLDINPDNINDNAIVVNFSNTIVSTINQFTHGSDPMILRLTSIQMCYECVRPDPLTPRVGQYVDPNLPHFCENSPNAFESRAAIWEHHANSQTVYDFGDGRIAGYPNVPNTWVMYNRFYHFDDGGKTIILHDQEIDNVHNKTVLYNCGKIQVNRAFMVNPGHRIIFKFSIWKNDLVLANDCRPIAEALNVIPCPPCPKPEPVQPVQPCPVQPVPTPYPLPYYPYPFYPFPIVPPAGKDKEYELILKLIDMNKEADKKQDDEIKDLYKEIKELAKAIAHKPTPPAPHPPVPPIPPTPPIPPVPHPHPHHPPAGIKMIMDMIKTLQAKVDELIEKTGDTELVPISDEEIQAILDALEADWDDNGEYDESTPYPYNDESGEEAPDEPTPDEPVDPSEDPNNDEPQVDPVDPEPEPEPEPTPEPPVENPTGDDSEEDPDLITDGPGGIADEDLITEDPHA